MLNIPYFILYFKIIIIIEIKSNNKLKDKGQTIVMANLR